MAHIEVGHISAGRGAYVQVEDIHNHSSDGLGIEDRCLQSLSITDPKLDKQRIEASKGRLLGDPGNGKTMLLCGIIDELKKNADNTVSYFLCQATDTRLNSATAVLRGLILMLVRRHKRVLHHITDLYREKDERLFTDANANEALKCIITKILHDLDTTNFFVIIDALDECVTDLPFLLDVILDAGKSSRAKWIISSRNWPDIGGTLADTKHQLHLELNEDLTSAAVDIYIQEMVTDLAKQKSYDSETQHVVETHLTSNAKGTFLWVSLVCQQLAEFDNVINWNAQEMLRKFPTGLANLYKRMLDQIDTYPSPQQCKQILATLLVAYRPLALVELGFIQGKYTPETTKVIVEPCGSFLSIQDDIVYFVHQSAKDYLLDQAANQIFKSSVRTEHHDMFCRSLEFLSISLRRDIYNLGAPGALIDEIDPPTPDPLAALRYSCVYWVDHFLASTSDASQADAEVSQNYDRVKEFLEKEYLYWLEALSLLRAFPEGLAEISKLDEFISPIPHISKSSPSSPTTPISLPRRPKKELERLVRDAQMFASYNRVEISAAPPQIYDSAFYSARSRARCASSSSKESYRGIFDWAPTWIYTGMIICRSQKVILAPSPR
ncbi:nacht nucleoside triphosphatase [Grosmannia clavigera kw1407]|uniref:Nacht nucleoside triphosphatase n=1 Tax=Grosmannia clavigera (strain kw1407 / UAMH 11150) TaxID=655863 RepID=F0XQL0_GROCL|nr:nacht nucleoside triphosphatase [Grosmannia clavigera kw1407]EFW99768.1 nacht nucleoside triphosphatase [Grosmannia clavigera kw1407]